MAFRGAWVVEGTDLLDLCLDLDGARPVNVSYMLVMPLWMLAPDLRHGDRGVRGARGEDTLARRYSRASSGAVFGTISTGGGR